MAIVDPVGEEWRLHRRWWPWAVGTPRPTEPVAVILPAELIELALRLLLLPVVALLRAVHVMPWPIEARRGPELVRTESVRGWRRSGERMNELAEAIRRGEPLDPARRDDVDGDTA